MSGQNRFSQPRNRPRPHRRRSQELAIVAVIVVLVLMAILWWGITPAPSRTSSPTQTEAAVAQESEGTREKADAEDVRKPANTGEGSGTRTESARQKKATAQESADWSRLVQPWRRANGAEGNAIRAFLLGLTDPNRAEVRSLVVGAAKQELDSSALERKHNGITVTGTAALRGQIQVVESGTGAREAIGCVDPSGLQLRDSVGDRIRTNTHITLHRFSFAKGDGTTLVKGHTPDPGKSVPTDALAYCSAVQAQAQAQVQAEKAPPAAPPATHAQQPQSQGIGKRDRGSARGRPGQETAKPARPQVPKTASAPVPTATARPTPKPDPDAGAKPTKPQHPRPRPSASAPDRPTANVPSPTVEPSPTVRPSPAPPTQVPSETRVPTSRPTTAAPSTPAPSPTAEPSPTTKPNPAPPTAKPSDAPTPVNPHDGASSDTAAASCWDIKRRTGSTTSKNYWIQTRAMATPIKVHCDMVTDGGGWALIGRGREGWSTSYAGQRQESVAVDPEENVVAQLGAEQVGALTGGQAPESFQDGFMLRRATDNNDGEQTVRFSVSNMARFSWALNSTLPVTKATIDGQAIDPGTGARFGTANTAGHLRVDTTKQALLNYAWGFAFGTPQPKETVGTGGKPAAGDRIAVAPGAKPVPHAQLYVRPRLTQTNQAAAGKSALPSTVASSARNNSWGVTGRMSGGKNENYTPVQAFAESGEEMMVGGNFATIQPSDTGQTGSERSGAGRSLAGVSQPYLAAFDRASGAWKAGFRPRLNGQVKALATLPGGRLAVGGDFSEANGEPAAGLVVLNSADGSTDKRWKLTLENRAGVATVSVRSLHVVGKELYIGGAFTHVSAPKTTVYARNAARVNIDVGTPDPEWAPAFSGTVTDLTRAPGSDWVFAAGYFRSDLRPGSATADTVAKISAQPGATIQDWKTRPSAPERDYRWAWAAVETHGLVFIGGTEHYLRAYDVATLGLKAAHITKAGGDFQAIRAHQDVVYAACHCDQFTYTGAEDWKLKDGFEQVDAIDLVGAWDAATGELLPAFQPKFRGELGQGVWALTTDSDGRLWAGGDITHAAGTDGTLRFTGGFAVFAPQPPVSGAKKASRGR